MKIRNLAFCGVMASILGVSGAYAAGDATIIASKAYVDARDNLKENVDNKETATYAASTNKTSTTVYPSMYTLDSAVSNLNTTIGTNALSTNVLENGVDGTKLTKASAITAAKSTTNLATTGNDGTVTIGNGDDTHFPTTKVVADTIKALDSISNTSNTAADNAVSAVSQADGQVSVTTAKLSAAAIDSSAKADSNILRNADDTDLVVVGGVKDTVARQGTLNEAWNQEFNASAATTAGATNLYTASINGRNPETGELYMDEFVPTVAAVEKRVQLAERNAQSNTVVDNWTSADGDTTHAPSRNVVYDSINVATAGNVISAGTAVNTNLTALDTKIGNTDMGTTNTTLTGAIAEVVSEKADKVTGLTASTDAMNIVTYNADGMVTGGKKLNTTGLNNINASTTGTCSVSNPCVLTYTGTDYKWTNMDTDSLSAVADTNS